jgi:hypothetical protein
MTTETTYHHLYNRVDYPMEHGYRMEPMPLPNWMHISITQDGDNKQLIVHSRIHKNKEVKINPVYSHKFTDRDIIKDLSEKIYDRFLR